MCGVAAAAVRPAAAQDMPHDTAAVRRFWVRPVASLVAPGTGQFLAGQDRGAVYLAAELYMLLRFVRLQRDGDRQAAAFRRLAFDVARQPFTTVRRDTVFEYYEQMERFTESGAFDGDPGPGFTPEADETTYNGAMWRLARRTFWADPDAPGDPTSLEYQQALEFYRQHAVGPAFRWSWRDAALEHQVFRETIRKSDSALRRARSQLGVLLANHMASAVDAIISRRLAAVAQRRAEMRTTFVPGGASVRFLIAF